jgi:hypothetical protein
VNPSVTHVHGERPITHPNPVESVTVGLPTTLQSKMWTLVGSRGGRVCHPDDLLWRPALFFAQNSGLQDTKTAQTAIFAVFIQEIRMETGKAACKFAQPVV